MRAQRDPQIAAGIARFGLFMFGVGYGECHVAGCECEPSRTPWCYTVGRVESGAPELVIVGLPWREALPLANAAHRAMQRAPDRGRWRLGGYTVRVDPLPGEWLAADIDRMGVWFEYYLAPGRSIRHPAVVQLVWRPNFGYFPDHPRCDRFSVERQPLLWRDPSAYPEIVEPP